MSNLLVPIGGFGLVILLAFTLIGAIMLRPWAGPDTSWRTHTNLREEPFTDDYTRSVQSFVSPEGSAPIQVWGLDPKATSPSEAGEGRQYFVAGGCASCHGLTAEGGVVGPDLLEVTASEVRRKVRKGPEGMPAFHDQDLTDEQLVLIAEYLNELQVAKAATAPPTSSSQPTPPVSTTPTPGAGPTPIPSPTPSSGAGPSPTPPPVPGSVSLEAAAAKIIVDGETSDWAAIPGVQVTLQQIKPIPGKEMGELAPVDVTLKVAADSTNVYVLLEVPDDFDYVADDHGLSAAMAIMFRIDEPAAPHMGAKEENQRKSLGVVDIWHWELDCGPGEKSGGNDAPSGNDHDCNLDDEYSTTPKDREDDGTSQAENSLAGVWDHTARAQGQGSDGTWVFEISRPLNTGDPQDAQLQLGGKAYMALAYWDADETPDGWTDLGHLQSASGGWIDVSLPTATP